MTSTVAQGSLASLASYSHSCAPVVVRYAGESLRQQSARKTECLCSSVLLCHHHRWSTMFRDVQKALGVEHIQFARAKALVVEHIQLALAAATCANSSGVCYASASRDVRVANTNGGRRVSTQATFGVPALIDDVPLGTASRVAECPPPGVSYAAPARWPNPATYAALVPVVGYIASAPAVPHVSTAQASYAAPEPVVGYV